MISSYDFSASIGVQRDTIGQIPVFAHADEPCALKAYYALNSI
jgi:hypothetical protein